ncbi:hypothetical protein FHS83_001002 [Rhizomicrobium palustre]|uniref:Uncharacterized protein n=1 Tax=Rhizomicrobium palustre TaxID=189966 RepID=A0A846MVZ9_9PROT|nr:hypothetical protein [Rhizomicrobium palustre]
MIGLLVTGSHGFASGTAPLAPPRSFWRRVIDWLMGR